MGSLRRRRRERALNEDAIAHVLSGRDVHEGSPFYEKQTPEKALEMELLFGRAGMNVALYVLQRPDCPAEPSRLSLAAKAMFADASAKAEFHLRCQGSDSAEVEAWFSGHCDACWGGFLEKNPSAVDLSKDAAIRAARSLIVENWENVMTMATAYAAPSIDVEGREFEFLDEFYADPALGEE
jgi:hypothetical protein